MFHQADVWSPERCDTNRDDAEWLTAVCCEGVAALSWPSTLMKCGTTQDVTGCATLAAEQLQVRSSVDCFTFKQTQFDCWMVFFKLPIWTPPLLPSGRREGTGHLGGGQAGGADLGGGLFPGGEAHSSEAAGHLAGQRSSQEEEDDQDHRAVAAAGGTSHRAPAAARLPRVRQVHASVACLVSSPKGKVVDKLLNLFLKCNHEIVAIVFTFQLYSMNLDINHKI